MKSHPIGLFIASFFEAFERFGYYLVLAIYLLFLNEKLGYSIAEASSLYGTFIALVYLSPLFGGRIADRIGLKLSIGLGMVLMAIGYLVIGLGNVEMLYTGMAAITIGNGLFKPAMSALVGSLYTSNDPRRDSAFNIFYLAVNIGALFSPIVAAYMKTHYGWLAAFQTAGWALLVASGLFVLTSKYIKVAADTVVNKIEEVVTPEVQKLRNKAFYFMCALVIVFWVAFHQNGSTLTLWARDNTDRTFGGLFAQPIDPVYYGALNSMFIIWLSPKLVNLLSWLRNKGLEPNTPSKIGIGMLLTGVAYSIIAIAGLFGNVVSSWWFVTTTFVQTCGELFLSPVGLSMATRLAPAGMLATTLGIWYLATAIGNKLSGQIGIYWEVWSHPMFFGVLAAASFVMSIILFAKLKWLNTAMPVVTNTADDSLVPPDIVSLHKNKEAAIRNIIQSTEPNDTKLDKISTLVTK
jgi:POT family proton-dependent oligopeptide transporter